MKDLENRKKDHIEMALHSQTPVPEMDPRFHYEPLLSAHPGENELDWPVQILGKTLRIPLWVSSMTGGTELAGTINRNLARACREFGMGMGLGSCRSLLESDAHLPDFDVRDVIGEDAPLWANLGIAQVEQLLASGRAGRAHDLVRKLRADGLIIHVNPMQEFFQDEGDRLTHPPLDTIRRFLDLAPYPLMVKEVGQGMGPESLRALLNLPLQAIEFGAFGGTNFARLELMRKQAEQQSVLTPLTRVGEDAFGMLATLRALVEEREPQCREIIISGGIRNYLDGYYGILRSPLPALYGMASAFLKHARGDYDRLRSFVVQQRQGLAMARAYLQIRPE
ncbi:MAG: hypothetical protein R2751_14145 [Bacteroidales bacterium]